MSNDVTAPAWKTKLKSSPAKTVLVRLAESANEDGFGYPSIKHICEQTELSKRQVQRVLQVFQEIGLVAKGPGGMGPKGPYKYSFQINMSMLQKDLCVSFRMAFLKAQGKSISEGVSETVKQPVSETLKGVSETPKSVSETLPPHPLYGGTVMEPSGTASGASASGGEHEVHPVIVSDIVDGVMRGCGVSNRRRRPAITEAVKLAIMLGEVPQTLAARMVEAWQEQAEMNNQGLLRLVFGLERFLSDGKWNHPETWHWNHEKLDRQREARVGVR